jgi:hypothetical protein
MDPTLSSFLPSLGFPFIVTRWLFRTDAELRRRPLGETDAFCCCTDQRIEPSAAEVETFFLEFVGLCPAWRKTYATSRKSRTLSATSGLRFQQGCVFLGFSIRQEPQFRKDTAPDRDHLRDSDLGGRLATELGHIPIRWIRAQGLTLHRPQNYPRNRSGVSIDRTRRGSTWFGASALYR